MPFFKYKFLVVFLLLVANAVFSVAPPGYYYLAKNKKQAELKTALHQIAGPQFLLDYGGGQGFTWEGFFYADQRPDGSVVDMYSNNVRKFNGFVAVTGMHIEHSFPKSWWGAHNNDAYKDLFHLYPADATTNITKSNLPLGEVTGTAMLDNGVSKIGVNGFGTTYTDNCFEPADEYKGDFARSYFYISTIYQNYYPLWSSPMLENNTYPVWRPWAIDLLLKWHRQDPVSAKELARIEAIYNIQGNRNPFIDYPDLAEYIWGTNTDKVFPFPEETQPFLLTPRRGTKVDFGVILTSDTRQQIVRLQGVNITTDVQLSLVKSDGQITVYPKIINAAAASAGTDIQLQFTPLDAGLVRDTLLIQGGGLLESIRVPIKALASHTFIALEPDDVCAVGGNLRWLADPKALSYKINVYQGDSKAGDVIISNYVEGSSWNKAIEIYNGTGKTVDLSEYSLTKQSDGAGAFSATTNLSGLLENNKTFSLVHRKSTNSELLAKAQQLDTIVLNMNGNDAIALQRNGVVIDMIGYANGGADNIWGLDKSLQRKTTVTHPQTVYNESQWNVLPIDTWSMLGTHTMNLTATPVYVIQNQDVGNNSNFVIHQLKPESTYTYKVISVRTDGDIETDNSQQIHTLNLDVPILMQPTAITSSSFKANWEETLYASGYLLNVFELKGQADVTENEGFDLVGLNGKPLPLGWIGTASGNYTSTQSSGVAIPSIALKAEGEYLQTKTYALPLKKFSYMYKFASSAPGSSLVVYAMKNNIWQRIDSIVYSNTSKAFPLYNFSSNEAVTAIRFIYHKAGSANLAIDDVQAIYGNLEPIYQCQNLPVAGTTAVIENLKPNTDYFYNVRATFADAVSLMSETVGLKTKFTNFANSTVKQTVKVGTRPSSVFITGLQGNEKVQLYSVSGLCVASKIAGATELEIPVEHRGVFVVSIQNSNYSYTVKCVK